MRATRARIGANNVVDTHAGDAGGELDSEKDGSLVFWAGAPNSTTIGERRALAAAVFERKNAGARRDEGASTGVAQRGAENAGRLQQQR